LCTRAVDNIGVDWCISGALGVKEILSAVLDVIVIFVILIEVCVTSRMTSFLAVASFDNFLIFP